MDLVNQNKMRNWVIGFLLVLNLLTVSIIWMQTARRAEPRPKEDGTRAPGSVSLMKQMLNLDEAQAKRFEAILASGREQSKAYADRLTELKSQLALELFKEKPDTVLVSATAREIGKVQATVELIRYRYFQELLTVCSPEQREKLKPIVMDVFGRKPPAEESLDAKARRPEGGKLPPPEKSPGEQRGERPDPPRGDRPAPPSPEEKLGRYVEELRLSVEQTEKVRAVLAKSQQEGERLRAKDNLDPNEIEAAREEIRKREEAGIMAVLSVEQKREFAAMNARRRPGQ
jgi:hypothetical protein